jgi:hypothetical protein
MDIVDDADQRPPSSSVRQSRQHRQSEEERIWWITAATTEHHVECALLRLGQIVSWAFELREKTMKSAVRHSGLRLDALNRQRRETTSVR